VEGNFELSNSPLSLRCARTAECRANEWNPRQYVINVEGNTSCRWFQVASRPRSETIIVVVSVTKLVSFIPLP